MVLPDRISLYRLILSITEAMDFVCPEVAGHQHRVAYVALRIAGQLGMDKDDRQRLFLAAALHDIGLIGVKDRQRYLVGKIPEQADWHGEMGCKLLQSSALFEEAAEIVRHHHLNWADGLGASVDGREVPFSSHLIHLADSVVLSIDSRRPVLAQTDGIVKMLENDAGRRFPPQMTAALLKQASSEAFWLDCTSHRIYSYLLELMDEQWMDLDDVNLEQIARVFSRLVDVMSRWTAAHSAGVAAVAVALAEKLHFSPREIHFMRIAGLLHDIGKLAVPVEILDGYGKPDRQGWAHLKAHTYHTYRILEGAGFPRTIVEWAAFHHERIDGQGYPFRVADNELSLGSRIMAVADTFTALTEERPYRDEGFSTEETMSALQRMALDGALDPEVVAVLNTHRKEIDETRSSDQAGCSQYQEQLLQVMTPVPV